MRVSVVVQSTGAWRRVAGVFRATGVVLLHAVKACLLASLLTASPYEARAQQRSAETLVDALVQTYKGNPLLNAERARLRGTD